MAGRNDPCPCGSGKKYKKCCLKQDQAARWAAAERSASEAAAAPPALWPAAPGVTQPALGAGEADEVWWDEPEAPAEVSAEAATLYARWEEFKAAEDTEGQIALFLRTLDEGLLDAETAFEIRRQHDHPTH